MAAFDDESAPEGPGQRLKLSREQRGLSVAEVSDALHLDRAMIEALEADDYQNLPPATFTKGYLRAYARYLGLNEDVLLASYDRFNKGDDQRPLTAAVGAEGKAANARRGGGWFVWLLLLAALLGGGAFLVISQDRVPEWLSDISDEGLDAVMPADDGGSAASGASDGDGVGGTAQSRTTAAEGAEESDPDASDSDATASSQADAGEGTGAAGDGGGERVTTGADSSAPGEGDGGSVRPSTSASEQTALRDGMTRDDGTPAGAATSEDLRDGEAGRRMGDEVDPRRALENDPLMGAESLLESDEVAGAPASGEVDDFGGPLSEEAPEPGRESGVDDAGARGDGVASASASRNAASAPDDADASATEVDPAAVDAVAPNDGQALLSPTPEAPEADPADMATLVFTFEGQSWMEVRDARGRDLLFELVAEPGRREVRGVPPFQLVIGDVEQVEVRYKGEPVDLNAYSRQGMARLELGGS